MDFSFALSQNYANSFEMWYFSKTVVNEALHRHLLDVFKRFIFFQKFIRIYKPYSCFLNSVLSVKMRYFLGLLLMRQCTGTFGRTKVKKCYALFNLTPLRIGLFMTNTNGILQLIFCNHVCKKNWKSAKQT